MSAFQAKVAAPPCTLGIRTRDARLAAIVFLPLSQPGQSPEDPLAAEACRQIGRFLEDPGFRFSLPLAPAGTVFQKRVWRCIAAIPPGSTRTYGDIAEEIGSAPRAVGQACGSNPFPLVIPCHRVVSAAGLGGFAHHDRGFLPGVKRWLLGHEGVAC